LDVGLFWITGARRTRSGAVENERGTVLRLTRTQVGLPFWNLILTTGTRPLRLITLMGFGSMVLAIAIAGYACTGNCPQRTVRLGIALDRSSPFSPGASTASASIAEYLALP